MGRVCDKRAAEAAALLLLERSRLPGAIPSPASQTAQDPAEASRVDRPGGSQQDMLCVWCKLVKFGAGGSPGSPELVGPNSLRQGWDTDGCPVRLQPRLTLYLPFELRVCILLEIQLCLSPQWYLAYKKRTPLGPYRLQLPSKSAKLTHEIAPRPIVGS